MTAAEIATAWGRCLEMLDLDCGARLLATHAVIHNLPLQERLIGPDAWRETARVWTEAFDVTVHHHDTVVEQPDRVKIRFDVQLKHVRPFHSRWGDIAPSNAVIELPVEHHCRIADDRIVELRSTYDLHRITSALGVTPRS